MLKSVLVTGGGSGIGAALAVALAERGCQVIISGRRLEMLKPVAEKSANITAHVSDVTCEEDQTELAGLLSELPGPRGLFHAAGYFQLGRLENLTAADWSRSFETNVTARWALSKKCAPYLEGGRILFIGSDSARNIRPGGAAYSVAQAASETLRRALQAEWAEKNIGIAAFKPGLVDTDMVRGFLSVSQEQFPAKQAFQSYIDRGEFATPERLAQFATWLMLDVDTHRFESTEWDLRETHHHAEWSHN